MRKKSIQSATHLIRKVKGILLHVIKLRAELEKILSEHAPEDFGELKLNEWDNFDYELTEHFQQIKDDVQTLISSTTAYLKEDRSESQQEVLKVAIEGKKLRTDVDNALK